MREYYEHDNANPHRGAYELSARATERYHAARERIARFLGVARRRLPDLHARHHRSAQPRRDGVGARRTSRAGDEIVVTALEHHANFVPWQQLALARGAQFRVCPLTADSAWISMRCARWSARGRRSSRSTTCRTRSARSIRCTRSRASRASVGALVVCDGAQGAPHLRVGFDALGVDFYAFSGHKMCGPMGIGGLIGRRAILEAMPPYQFGGDMIEFVRDDHSTWNVLPHKFEAGTPERRRRGGARRGVRVSRRDRHGRRAARTSARSCGWRPSGCARSRACASTARRRRERSGVVSFTVADIHPHDLATILDQDGVCIRAGHHCAQPLMRRLGVSATARASFYVYNDESDVDALVRAIERAKALFATPLVV